MSRYRLMYQRSDMKAPMPKVMRSKCECCGQYATQETGELKDALHAVKHLLSILHRCGSAQRPTLIEQIRRDREWRVSAEWMRYKSARLWIEKVT